MQCEKKELAEKSQSKYKWIAQANHDSKERSGAMLRRLVLL